VNGVEVNRLEVNYFLEVNDFLEVNGLAAKNDRDKLGMNI
jgi:hypothetical protein